MRTVAPRRLDFAGAVLMVVTLIVGLLERARDKNIPAASVISAGGGRQIFQIVCIALFFICFALAAQGDEASAVAIKRSATAELSVAAVVLAITALLVSLPSPRTSGPPGAGGPPNGGGLVQQGLQATAPQH